jgi:hypothetical protein
VQNGSTGILSFTGTLTAINQAMVAGVTYTPAAGFIGADPLSVTVNDQTVPLFAAGTVDISVAPIVLSGPSSAGTNSYTSTPAPVYELTGATITGAGGHGLNVVTTDADTTDALTVLMDSTSSILVSGSNFNGLNLATSGANIVVTADGMISASGSGSYGIYASVLSGNGSVSVNALANVSGASQGIRAFTSGSGSVNVNVGPGPITITGSALYGIWAYTNASGAIAVSTAVDDTINSGSAAIIAENYSTTVSSAAQSTISVTASGTINSGATLLGNGNKPSGIIAGYAANLLFDSSVFGNVTVNNFANITAAGHSGIFAYNYGIGDITVSDAAGTSINNTAGNGITAVNYGPGNISVSTSVGDVVSSTSGGVIAVSYATAGPAKGAIVVTTYGTINSGSTLLNSGALEAGVLAEYVGGTSSPANPPNPSVFGDVTINNSANVTAAGGDGIRAQNYGIGNVTIIDQPGTTITATAATTGSSTIGASRYGIYAANYSPGNTVVTTSTGDVINSASVGIVAENDAASVLASSNSSVVVTARGTMSSNGVLTGAGNPAAGILAGFNGGSTSTPNSNVVGNVIVDDFASITAPAGTDGIRAFNYGTFDPGTGIGTVMITAESSAVIAAGRYGISGNGNATVDVTIVSSATVSGGTAGINVQAVKNGTLSGNVSITVSGGTISSPLTAVQVSTTGSVIIENSGEIIHGTVAVPSAAGISISETTGSSATINNFNTIIGDVTLGNATFNNHNLAVWDVSGSNTFGAGTNTLNNDSMINVQGSSSFTATGTLNVTGTGSFTIADGAMLEFGGSVAATQTVIFTATTTTETLKIDHSLTAPFSGHISGLTGSLKDAIDLADLPYGAKTTAVYTPLTSTLTVSDGNGHTEQFNLVNYTGTGSFSSSSDSTHGGTGGTWIVDPPATMVTVSLGATVELNANSNSSAVDFQGTTGKLIVDQPSSFTGQIQGFTGDGTLSGSDQIDLGGINYDSGNFTDSYSNGILTVSDGTHTANLHFTGSYSLGNFKFASDSHGGTIVYDPPIGASTQTTTETATVDNGANQGGSSVITPAATLPSGTTITASSANQTLTGTGSNDTFVFAPGFSHDTITNFQPTTDVLQIDHSVFANVQALLAATHDDGHGNVVITADAHDSITLQHVTVAQLQAHHGDFHII